MEKCYHNAQIHILKKAYSWSKMNNNLKNKKIKKPLVGKHCLNLTIISDAMIIWRRMQNNSRSFFLSFNDLEERLLANPKDVFYGSVLSVKLTFKTVPCNITTVSPSYLRVKPINGNFFFWQIKTNFLPKTKTR